MDAVADEDEDILNYNDLVDPEALLDATASGQRGAVDKVPKRIGSMVK